MSNSKNNNLEDVSKGNDESAPRANDSTSNKKTRFTKSKSISEVFKELEFDDSLEDKYSKYDFDDSSEDEIIPIHNEYRDLDKSDALAEESVEGGVIINPDADVTEENVRESIEYEIDVKENADSISETDSDEFTESLSVETDFDDYGESIIGVENMDDEGAFIIEKNGNELADEDMDGKIGKSSAQGVLINDKDKTPDSKKSIDIFNSSTILSIVGFIVGLGILLIGITYYASSSDRVVDNVLSGETAGLAIFLVIIGLIIIGFSLLKFFSSSKSSIIIDTFNSLKSIDYDEMQEEGITRDDFDAVFGIFKRKKDSNFSDNDQSVDSSKDLFEDDEDEVSDDDISSLYSESNLTSQKNQTSSKGHENANSTEISDNYDDGVDEIIPIHSELNEQSDSLEDKYSKYDFEDDFDEDYDLVEEEEIIEDSMVVDDSMNDYDLADEGSVEDYDLVEDNSDGGYDLETEETLEHDQIEENVEEDVGSNLEAKKMDGLKDKYSKYDFEDETEEPSSSKPKFKKSVDLSKFEREPLSEDELAEQKRIAQEKMLEKKRRIIEGTNFDNSLRKQ